MLLVVMAVMFAQGNWRATMAWTAADVSVFLRSLPSAFRHIHTVCIENAIDGKTLHKALHLELLGLDGARQAQLLEVIKTQQLRHDLAVEEVHRRRHLNNLTASRESFIPLRYNCDFRGEIVFPSSQTLLNGLTLNPGDITDQLANFCSSWQSNLNVSSPNLKMTAEVCYQDVLAELRNQMSATPIVPLNKRVWFITPRNGQETQTNLTIKVGFADDSPLPRHAHGLLVVNGIVYTLLGRADVFCPFPAPREECPNGHEVVELSLELNMRVGGAVRIQWFPLDFRGRPITVNNAWESVTTTAWVYKNPQQLEVAHKSRAALLAQISKVRTPKSLHMYLICSALNDTKHVSPPELRVASVASVLHRSSTKLHHKSGTMGLTNRPVALSSLPTA